MIKKIGREEVPHIERGGRIIKDIEEFIKSGNEMCEVFFEKTRDASSVNASYYNTIKRLGYPVKVMRRKDRLFLLRKEEGEKA